MSIVSVETLREFPCQVIGILALLSVVSAAADSRLLGGQLLGSQLQDSSVDDFLTSVDLQDVRPPSAF